jgi:preprotein translocase subunit SecA
MKKYIHLRAYGQKDPKIEYQKESFGLFNTMLDRIREQSVEYLFRIQAPRQVNPPVLVSRGPAEEKMLGTSHSELKSPLHKTESRPQVTPIHKIGRNDPCPCGSGKKYKKCCGA